MTDTAMIEAKRQDVPAMVAVLAAAFVDEPALSWLLPDPPHRHARLTTFFAPLNNGTMRHASRFIAAPGRRTACEADTCRAR